MPSSESETTEVIKLQPDMQLETLKDLRRLTDNQAMAVYLKDYYGNIDIYGTFQALVDCGQLLQLALFAAGDKPCSVHILRILSNYQGVVHSSMATTHSFITSSIVALTLHVEALNILGFVQGEQVMEALPDVLDYLSQCYDTAVEMETKANDQATQVEVVVGLAVEALLAAKDDVVNEVAKQKNYEQMINKLKAEKEANDKLKTEYDKNIVLLSKDKSEAVEAAATARNRGFAIDIINAVAGSLGEVAKAYGSIQNPYASMGADLAQQTGGIVDGKLNDQTTVTPEILIAQKEVQENELILENLRKSENAGTEEGKKAILKAEDELYAAKEMLKGIVNGAIAIAKAQAKNVNGSNSDDGLQEQVNILTERYHKMLDAQMKAAADQARNLEELRNMKDDKSEVEQAIFLLKFVVGILGQVHTTFLNVETFWKLLADDCKKIAGLKVNLMSHGDKLVDPNVKESMYDYYRQNFKKFVKKGGKSWAVIGRISILAYDSITEAKETIDGVMVSLPTDTITKDTLNALINQMEPRVKDTAEKHKGIPPKAIEN